MDLMIYVLKFSDGLLVHSDLRDIDISNIFHNVCVVVAVGRIIFGVVAVRIIFGFVVVAVVGSLWNNFLPALFRFVLAFSSLHICHLTKAYAWNDG